MRYGPTVDVAPDIRLTFDGVAALYERARPTYPSALFHLLFAQLPTQPHIVEMGPGTGQATEHLLARGARVTAVEMGPTLAATLARKHRDHDALTVVNATFEEADLAPGSFDAVFAATAYHWVGVDSRVERPLELLARGGVLAVLDLMHVDSSTDAGYFAAVQSIYDRHQAAQRPRPPRTYADVVPPIADQLRASGRFESIVVHRHRWDQAYTSAEYRDLLMTYSGTLMKPEPERSEMVNALIEVADKQFDGRVTRPLCATLTVATTRG